MNPIEDLRVTRLEIDRKVAENMAHEALKKITDEWNGEWFKLELQVVQNIISELTI